MLVNFRTAYFTFFSISFITILNLLYIWFLMIIITKVSTCIICLFFFFRLFLMACFHDAVFQWGVVSLTVRFCFLNLICQKFQGLCYKQVPPKTLCLLLVYAQGLYAQNCFKLHLWLDFSDHTGSMIFRCNSI